MHLNPIVGVVGVIPGCPIRANYILSHGDMIIGTCAVERLGTGEISLTFVTETAQPWIQIRIHGEQVAILAGNQSSESLRFDTHDKSRVLFVVDNGIKLEHSGEYYRGRQVARLGTAELFLLERLLISGESNSGVRWKISEVEFI